MPPMMMRSGRPPMMMRTGTSPTWGTRRMPMRSPRPGATTQVIPGGWDAIDDMLGVFAIQSLVQMALEARQANLPLPESKTTPVTSGFKYALVLTDGSNGNAASEFPAVPRPILDLNGGWLANNKVSKDEDVIIVDHISVLRYLRHTIGLDYCRAVAP